MKPLHIKIYGTRLRFVSERSDVLEALRRDFAYFLSEPNDSPNFEIELRPNAPQPTPRAIALFSAPRYRVYAGLSRRWVLYRGGDWVFLDRENRRAVVGAEDPARLHELGYLLALSEAGVSLDKQGLHRVHGLGFELDGEAGLLLLPSGGGKSSIALELLRRSEAGFFSDDTPLVDIHGHLHAFPLRWAVKPSCDLSDVPPEMIRSFKRKDYGPKLLIDTEYFSRRIRRSAPLRWILIGQRTGGSAPRLRPAGPWEAVAALLTNMVIGVGIPQMAEYRLGPMEAPSLARTALRRLAAARGALRRARTWRLELGGSPATCADFLVSMLKPKASAIFFRS